MIENDLGEKFHEYTYKYRNNNELGGEQFTPRRRDFFLRKRSAPSSRSRKSHPPISLPTRKSWRARARVLARAPPHLPTFKFMQSSFPRTRFPGFSLFTCRPVIRFATTCCLHREARGKAKFVRRHRAENRVNKATREGGHQPPSRLLN